MRSTTLLAIGGRPSAKTSGSFLTSHARSGCRSATPSSSRSSAGSRRVVVERLHEARERSGAEWPLLLKRDGHEFHRAAREAWLAQGLALAGRD